MVFGLSDFDFLATGSPLEWPKDVADKLREFNQAKGRIEEEKLEFLRRRARELGFSAAELTDLISTRGNPFAEVEESHGRRAFRRAIEQGEDISRYDAEVAYLCAYPYALPLGSPLADETNANSCGWVRGAPREHRYDELAGHALAGSAGVRHYCLICEQMVGEDQHIVS